MTGATTARPDLEAPPAERLDEAVCLALYSTTHAVLGLYRDLLAPWGLTYQQLLVLALLWQDEPQSPGRIATALTLDSSSVTGLLSRLERDGLVRRELDPTDRRRVTVHATERAHEVRGQLGWLAACVTQASGLDHAEAGELIARLHALRAAVTAFPRPDVRPAAPPQPARA